MAQSEKAGETLGKLFKQMGNVAVQKNQQMMQDNQIPGFNDINYEDELGEWSIASSLTFTSNGFFN